MLRVDRVGDLKSKQTKGNRMGLQKKTKKSVESNTTKRKKKAKLRKLSDKLTKNKTAGGGGGDGGVDTAGLCGIGNCNGPCGKSSISS